MIRYIIRRLLFAIPTLIAISFIVFALLDLAPNDPTGQLPLTIPPEVRAQIRESLGLGQPFHVRYLKWMEQFFVNEPLNIVEQAFGVEIGDSSERLRVRSWATRSPVVDLIVERAPQTLWVVGLSYIVGILIAIPIGIISAWRQYSWFDQIGTFVSMVGFSVPTFFTGLLAIIIFSVMLQWLPSIYDTTHRVTDLASFWVHLKQLVMPVMVLALFNAAQLSRFMRAAMLDNLNLDYVRTARAKGVREDAVLLVHVLRNSMIPVVTLIALGIPTIFGGAIITEQIFRVNGLGQLLIIAIQGADIPLVQTLTFIFAVLIVLFNLVADVLLRDPRSPHPLRVGSRRGTTMSTPPATMNPRYEARVHRSLWMDVWLAFRNHTGALAGVLVFSIIVLAVTVGPFIHDADPQYLDIRAKNQGPSLAHPMGTDNLGRDMLAQVLAGGRISLAVGFTAMLLSLVLGTVVGVLAGYFDRLDGPLMRHHRSLPRAAPAPSAARRHHAVPRRPAHPRSDRRRGSSCSSCSSSAPRAGCRPRASYAATCWR